MGEKNILTIWADEKTQNMFKQEWTNFNNLLSKSDDTKTVTQQEYLKLIIESHKDRMNY